MIYSLNFLRNAKLIELDIETNRPIEYQDKLRQVIYYF